MSDNGYWYRPGRVNNKWAHARSNTLEISQEFYKDFRNLIYLNRGIYILTEEVALIAQGDYEKALKAYEKEVATSARTNNPEEHKAEMKRLKKLKRVVDALKPTHAHIYAVLDHIFHRTIRFNRVCECISQPQIVEGRSYQLQFSLNIKLSSVRDAFSMIERAGLIYTTSLTESESGRIVFIDFQRIVEVVGNGLQRIMRNFEDSDSMRVELKWAACQSSAMAVYLLKFYPVSIRDFVCSITTTDSKEWRKLYTDGIKEIINETFDPAVDNYKIIFEEMYPKNNSPKDSRLKYVFWDDYLLAFGDKDRKDWLSYNNKESMNDFTRVIIEKYFADADCEEVCAYAENF